MTITKRFLNLKVMAIVALLLFVVACYFAARKVLALDVEIGMNREQVVEVLGTPLATSSTTAIWEQPIFSKDVYCRFTVVLYKDGKVDKIVVCNFLFGISFQSKRESEM